MVIDFHCSDCDLKFSVGGFHYHCFNTGYGGIRLLVCQACGTQHQLECALRDRGPESYVKYRVTAQAVPFGVMTKLAQWLRRRCQIGVAEALSLVRQPSPVLSPSAWPHEAEAIRKELKPWGIVVDLQECERLPNPMFGPLLQDRLRASKGLPMARSPVTFCHPSPWSIPTTPRSVAGTAKRLDNLSARSMEKWSTALLANTQVSRSSLSG